MMTQPVNGSLKNYRKMYGKGEAKKKIYKKQKEADNEAEIGG